MTDGSEDQAPVQQPRFLLSYCIQSPPTTASSTISPCHHEKHTILPDLRHIAGFQRSRAFEIINATTLDRFERSDASDRVPGYMVLAEFCSEDVGTLVQVVEGVLGENRGEGEEMGWYRLKREYV